MTNSSRTFAINPFHLGGDRGLDVLRPALAQGDTTNVRWIDPKLAGNAGVKAGLQSCTAKKSCGRATLSDSGHFLAGHFLASHMASFIRPALRDVNTFFGAELSVAEPIWAQKVRQLRKRLGVSLAEFGKMVGVSAMSASSWERGINPPSPEFMIRLGRIAGDPDCWFFWEQAGLSRTDVVRVLPELEQRLHTRGEAKFELLPAPGTTHQTGSGVRLKKKPDAVAIPLLHDSAAAGSPRLIEEAVVERIVIADAHEVPHPLYTTCIRISGRSMYPILDDGYIVAVDTFNADPDRLVERMVAARDPEGGITIKWLRKVGDDYMLVPQHTAPEYPIALISRGPGWKVVGEVLWWIGTPPK